MFLKILQTAIPFVWLEIFHTTIDEIFAGERADFAKSRAEAIANRMLNFVRNVPDVRSMNRETFVNPQSHRE